MVVPAFFAVCAFGLARLSRLVSAWVRPIFRVLLSALVMPTAILVAGFIAFVESSIEVWLLSRPAYVWFNLALVILPSLLTAWFVIRRERSRMDSSVFD